MPHEKAFALLTARQQKKLIRRTIPPDENPIAKCPTCGPISHVIVDGIDVDADSNVLDDVTFDVSSTESGIVVCYHATDETISRWLNADVVFQAVREYVLSEECERVRCHICSDEFSLDEEDEDEDE